MGDPTRRERSWEIKTPDGKTVAIKHRVETLTAAGSGRRSTDRRPWWTLPDGSKGLGGLKVRDLPLYGSERLGEREPGDDTPAIIVEGEPAADALLRHNLPALGTVGGSGVTPCDASLGVLVGWQVVLWPDNAEDGIEHMRNIGAALTRMGVRWQMFTPSDLPPKGDAVEWIAGRESVTPFGEVQSALVETIEAEATAATTTTTEAPAGEVPSAARIAELLTLRERLARPVEPLEWRIEGWQPARTRVVLAAQFKAGKTVLVGNLVRSLLDGDLFLGHSAVHPVAGCVALLDLEMGETMLDAWLRAQAIHHDDRLLVAPLRGRLGSLDLLDDAKRSAWATLLRHRGVEYLVLDCLRPALDSLGLDEHREAGRFLVAFDELLQEAGIPEALVVHHFGHGPERSRGDSRLRDWPDVEWRLMRDQRDVEDPAAPRYLAAYGRDVDQGEQLLAFEPDSRRLTIAGGSRRDAQLQGALDDVIGILRAASEPLTGRKIKTALEESDHSRASIEGALRLGARLGSFVVEPGPKRSKLYRVGA